MYTVTATTLPNYAATTAETQWAQWPIGGNERGRLWPTPQRSLRDGHKVDDFHIGLPGWTIRAQLADGSGPVYTVVSDNNGYFRFAALPLGVYRFWEELQPGWTAVTPAEFEVGVLEPSEDCLHIRFKNKQAMPTPRRPAERAHLPAHADQGPARPLG